MAHTAQPPRRRNAQRTRAAILAAATEVLMSQRSSVAMHEIARIAGVGQATLYRHFRDRYTLAAAVVRHHMDLLKQVIADGFEQPEAFRSLMYVVLQCQISMRPLVRLLRKGDPGTRDRYLRQLVAVLAEPLERARVAGYVRADCVPTDLALVFAMVEGAMESAADPEAGYAAARRCIDLILDGMFTDPKRASPGSH